MFEPQTFTQSLDSSRLLGLLPPTFSSPIRLSAICDALSPESRRIQALGLVHTYFPGEMPEVVLNPNWYEILIYFLRLVHHHWFEIDWDTISLLEEANYYECPDLEEDLNDPNWESDALKVLVMVLEDIPFRPFSFNDEVSARSRIGVSPILLKLRDTFQVESLSQSLGQATNVDRKILPWLPLDKLPDQPLPLCWLPDMIRYVCGQTGNPWLDNSPNFINWVENDWFHWNKDIDLIKNSIRSATAIRRRARKFARWAEENEAAARGIETWLASPPGELRSL